MIQERSCPRCATKRTLRHGSRVSVCMNCRLQFDIDEARWEVPPRIEPSSLFNAAELKRRLYAVTSLDEVEGIFADYLASGAHLAPGGDGSETAEAADATESAAA